MDENEEVMVDEDGEEIQRPFADRKLTELSAQELRIYRQWELANRDPFSRQSSEIARLARKEPDEAAEAQWYHSLASRAWKWKNPEKAKYIMDWRRQQAYKTTIKVALVGQPNCGKSSLYNHIVNAERVIADGHKGTTIDCIATEFDFRGHQFSMIDTPGLEKGDQHSGDELLEGNAAMVETAIMQTDVVICVSDAEVSMIRGDTINCPRSCDLRLARLAIDSGKILVVVVNKWDTVDDEARDKFRENILARIDKTLYEAHGVPVIFTSAKHGLNISTMMNKILVLYGRWNSRVPTSKLNSWLTEFKTRWPTPWRNGQKINVKYICQTRARPPTMVLFSNVFHAKLPMNYVRQILNQMRLEFSMQGSPIKLICRSTMLPPPRKKLTKKELSVWKAMGPQQRKALDELNQKGHRKIMRQSE